MDNQHKTQKTSKFLFALCCLFFLNSGCGSDADSSEEQVIDKEPVSLEEVIEEPEIPVPHKDARVLHWINHYTGKKSSRRYMRKVLGRLEGTYKDMIIKKMEKRDLPLELLAIPVIESGYQHNLVSPKGAAGLWQLMPVAARFCGLTVSNQADERFTAARSTDGALCYLEELYSTFGNWPIVISSYNMGPTRMRRILKRAGHKDVFKLAREQKLGGKEANNYLPKVMAVIHIMNHPELLEDDDKKATQKK